MTQVSAQSSNIGDDVRPIVRTVSPNKAGLMVFIGMLAVGGLLLFQALSARRVALTASTTMSGASSADGVIAAPPPLALPAQLNFDPEDRLQSPPEIAGPTSATPAPVERIVTRVVEVAGPLRTVYAEQPTDNYRAPISSDYDRNIVDEEARPRAERDGGRVHATRLRNPAFTVPKGAIITAVLETALDSTLPGAVRAVVSRDVMGFDGTRILIPRGSRLYGEYGADMNYGQNRALIRWTRLLRPDAVVIDLDSPAADPLGRAGVKGRVNSHFFARFGSAILQSTLDIGVGIATRSVTDNAVILALPPGSQPKIADPETQVRPTLTVEHGTSVSVFVARDLDFATVDS